MRHTLFALFESPDAAARAVERIDQDSKCTGELSVLMHGEEYEHSELKLNETAAKREAGIGWVIGGVGGAVLGGLVAGPLGLVGGGALFTALMGGTYGSVLGALGGFLGGAAHADPRLKEIADKVENDKNVLVSVVVESLECEQHILKLFEGQGAIETHGNF